MLTVLTISGSLRRASHNTLLLHEAERLAPSGLRFDHYTGLGGLPLFDEDAETPLPAPVAELRARVAAADAVLLATPEYNAGIPGGLKNALDWLSRPAADGPPALKGRPVAILGVSAGPFGTVRAQTALRQVLHKMDVTVVGQPEFLLPWAGQQFEDGRLRADGPAVGVLQDVLRGLVALVPREERLSA